MEAEKNGQNRSYLWESLCVREREKGREGEKGRERDGVRSDNPIFRSCFRCIRSEVLCISTFGLPLRSRSKFREQTFQL